MSRVVALVLMRSTSKGEAETVLSWIRQSRLDSTCYPLDVADLMDEMDKKINPLAGEAHWVHNVHLVHGLVERAAFNCRF